MERPHADRCEGCPFGCGLAVGGRGNLQAPVVIVGEAPGINELREGRPFIGASGKLFNKVADLVGLPVGDDDLFVTNALRCIPPKSQGQPKAQEIHSCQLRLYQELGAADRQLIILLGATALRAVTDRMNAKITQERGKIFDTDFGPAIATFHPAALLRGAANYQNYLEDMTYAAEFVASGGAARRDPGIPEYTIVGAQNVNQVLRHLGTFDTLAADIETSAFNYVTDELLCVGISGKKNEVFIFPPAFIDQLSSLIAHPDITWVWHNGKFDTSFLRIQHGLPARVDEDTMLLHYAIDERPGTHGLKELSASLLGADDYEGTLSQYLPNKSAPYSLIPTEVLYKYLAHDVDNTFQLYQILKPQVNEDKDLRHAYECILIPASKFLQRVEHAGMPVDMEYLDELDTRLIARQEELYIRIQNAVAPYWDPYQYADDMRTASVPEEFNPGSPKQMKWMLFHPHALGMKVPKGFNMDTREDTIKQLNDTSGIVKAVLDYRGVAKAKGTYVDGIRERVLEYPDRRLHPTYLIHGTLTGRLSSRNPNAQNFPREAEIRNSITAEEGSVLIEADYSQAELRVLALLSQDAALIQIYRDELDLHNEVAEDFFQGWKHQTDYVLKREQRIRAKFVNFGIAYGRGPESISKEFGIPKSESTRYIERWYRRFPNARGFLEKCRLIAVQGGTLHTPFGRKRRFGFSGREKSAEVAAQNEAANFPIQSTASDLTLLSAMRIQERFDTEGYTARVINLVHDSILVECADNIDIIREVQDLMVETMRGLPIQLLGRKFDEFVPFDADTKVGKRWGALEENFDKFLELRNSEKGLVHA